VLHPVSSHRRTAARAGSPGHTALAVLPEARSAWLRRRKVMGPAGGHQPERV